MISNENQNRKNTQIEKKIIEINRKGGKEGKVPTLLCMQWIRAWSDFGWRMLAKYLVRTIAP